MVEVNGIRTRSVRKNTNKCKLNLCKGISKISSLRKRAAGIIDGQRTTKIFDNPPIVEQDRKAPTAAPRAPIVGPGPNTGRANSVTPRAAPPAPTAVANNCSVSPL